MSDISKRYKISKISREKIALFFLIAMILSGAYVIFNYFSTVTPFTVAATRVDEAAGTMNHYTALVYSGINDEASSSKNKANKTTNSKKDVVYSSDIYSEYLDKLASIATLNIKEFMNKDDCQIRKVGNKKIGIFSISSYSRKQIINKTVADLKSKGADAIICICPRSVMLGSFDEINAVVCTKEKSPSENEEGHVDNTLIVRSPAIGRVGVLTISNSNVVSQKVY